MIGERPQEIQTGAPEAAMDLANKFSSGISADESVEFARLINTLGSESFETSGVLGAIESSLANDASALATLSALKALAAHVDQWIEPFLINLFPSIVSLIVSDDSAIKEAAEETGRALFLKLISSAANLDGVCKLINDLGEDIAGVVGIPQLLETAMTNSATAAAALESFSRLVTTAEPWLVELVLPLYSTITSFFPQQEYKLTAEKASCVYLSKLVEAGKTSEIIQLAKEIGVSGIKQSGIVAALLSGVTMAPLSTVSTFSALCEEQARWLEPFMVSVFPSIMTLFADKSADVKAAVPNAALSFFKFINPQVAQVVLGNLFAGLEKDKDFLIKVGSCNLLAVFAEMYPTEVGLFMFDIVRALSVVCQDTKKQVKDAASDAFSRVGATIQNIDIKALIPVLLKAYSKPVTETVPALDKLLSTTFVNTVDAPTLGIIIPFLLRSFAERKNVMKRRSAVVVDSMCKLVNDPRDAAVFYPIIEPVLKRCIDEVPIEEVRNTCERSLETLNRVMGDALEKKANMMSAEQMEKKINEVISKQTSISDGYCDVIAFVSRIAHHLVDRENNNPQEWESNILPYLQDLLPSDKASEIVSKIIDGVVTIGEAVADTYDDEEDLCNNEFSLAYASRVLLHQTKLHLKKGRKYGLIGPNGAGKSTLMISIANGSLQGFPPELRTVYVEHGIQGDLADTPCVDYILQDPKVQDMNKDRAAVEAQLTSVGFTPDMLNAPIETLSGGWKMKLALSRAMLTEPDMLLLDEPTNHLDVNAVAWITKYIQDLTTVTCLLVSHDTKFLDNVCTDVLHYEPNLKLKRYRGNLSDFVKQYPAAKAYYELTATEEMKMKFPQPDALEGVKSTTKAILSYRGLSFQYKVASKPQLVDVNVQCSLASRVAVVGANGAGKSTLIKLMVGELDPVKDSIELPGYDQAEYYKHPNLRIAYVAQHAFHHVEQHLEKSPVEYIEWRFAGGVDKEQAAKEQIQMTEEELEELRRKAKAAKRGEVEEIKARKQGKREFEYEVTWVGGIIPPAWLGRKELEEMGYGKIVQAFDEQLAMEAASGQQKLTHGNIEKHLGNFGLGTEHASHNKISALSGGQKVKVVLAAAMWNKPHLLILDEPTNFLDRDSLGGLAEAIREFGGGVLMITHSREFYEALCPERWFLSEGRLTSEGAEWMEAVELARKRAEREAKKQLPKQEEEKFDALGNTVVEKKKVDELDRKQKKALMKKRKELLAAGQDTFEIDEILGLL